jgi:small nuclear ribonucleoprotein (snRNP)-like protein
MRLKNKFIISLGLCLSFQAYSEDKIMVVLEQPIFIGNSNSAIGAIGSLSPEAVQQGIDSARMKGELTFSKLPDSKTRVNINWSSIIKQDGFGETNTVIESPLVSQFVTNSVRIEPKTEISAKGDLSAFAESLNTVMEKAREDDSESSSNNSNSEKNDSSSKENDQAMPMFTDNNGSSGSSDVGATEDGGTTATQKDNVSVKSQTWESCTPRIDKNAGTVYERAKSIILDGNGGEIERGSCEDHGTTAAIQRVYGDICQNLHDFVDLKTYASYREFAELNGEEIKVSSCGTDPLRTLPLLTNAAACGIRHDFLKSQSIQQWKFFYNENGEIKDASECVDSDITYQHYQTTTGCTAVVDNANSLVFPSKRIAYSLNSGTIEYASECAPVGSESVALSTEFCEQKYEHDKIAGQSYRRIKSYYNDFTTGAKIFASDCTRDTSVSFPHIQETNTCSFINDDAQQFSVMNALTQIVTEDDGTILVSPCQQIGSRIYYSFQGRNSNIATKLYNDCYYNYKKDRASGGASDHCPSSIPASYHTDSRCDVHVLNSVQTRIDIWNYKDISYYRRGDGSTYSILHSNIQTCGPNT